MFACPKQAHRPQQAEGEESKSKSLSNLYDQRLLVSLVESVSNWLDEWNVSRFTNGNDRWEGKQMQVEEGRDEGSKWSFGGICDVTVPKQRGACRDQGNCVA